LEVEIVKKPLLAVVFLLLVIPHQVQPACEPNIPADLTRDCKVDFSDFAMMASDWFKPAVPHEWVARYNGPENRGDTPRAIAIDSSDNVYVTGSSEVSEIDMDYTTVKYSHDGNELWVARYGGPGTTAVSRAIAIDSYDNVYVTGNSMFFPDVRDYATIKYSPDGNELWVARYNGPNNLYDVASAIAIDSNDNIYVTGNSAGSGTGRDYATIKYSPDSNQPIWVARYDGPGNGNDSGYAIAIDSEDNIYVTGESRRSGISIRYDYATIKYSPDSNQLLWVARYEGSANSSNAAVSIAIDSSDNIYVTGTRSLSLDERDWATIKYSPDGNELWVATYDGPGHGVDFAEAIAIDSSDNIYVTGYSESSSTRADYTTVKYSPDSNQPVWVASYNGPNNDTDVAKAIAVDSNDNVYVTGYSTSSGTNSDYATIKYSPDSNEAVWVARYDGPGNAGDSPKAIAVDSSGHIYVTGRSYRSGPYADYATIKYSPDHTCTPKITGDFDLDCDVDIYDLEIFCQSWLDCNLEPPGACW
jgi:uncharacterized delta-60 repeat protein